MRAARTALALAVGLLVGVAATADARAGEPLVRRWPLIPGLADAAVSPPFSKKDLGEPCAGVSYPNPYSPLPKPLRSRHQRVTVKLQGARVELRDAFLVDLPRTITWDLVAPIGARLDLGYRLFRCGGKGPATLRVITEDALGKDEQVVALGPTRKKRERATPDGEPRPRRRRARDDAPTRTVDDTPERDDRRGWQDLSFDLRVAPGEPFRLTLALESEAARGELMLALAEPALSGREADVATDADTNVLWIVIDAVRSDALGPSRTFPLPTPTMDAIFAQGTAFSRAYAMGNQTRTSTTAMIGSVHPSIGGFHSHDWAFAKGKLDTFYKSSPPLVTGVLEQAGWRVAHFGHNFFLWGSDPVGIDAGFPRIVDFRSIPADAVDASDEAVKFFERHRDERWMLMLNYTAPHTPYQAPEAWDEAARALPGPERFGEHGHLPRSYLGEILWVDHNLTRVMEALARLGLDDDTLVIVTADHGEVMLPWHDCRGTGGERCGFNHSWTLYEDEVWVPLVFTLPGRVPARVVDAPVSHLDLAPTILDVLGQPPAPGMGGASLGPVLAGAAPEQRPIYADGRRAAMLSDGAWKLILHAPDDAITPRARSTPEDGETPKHELFDLVADPGETKNLVRARPDVLERMLADLKATRTELHRRFTQRGAEPALAGTATPATQADGSEADNRLMLVGGPDVRPLVGTVRAIDGSARCGAVPPGGECVARPDGSLAIKLDAPIGGQSTLGFTTSPWGAGLDLQLAAGWLGGAPLPADRLRLGAWGLALLRPGEALDRPERLALAARSDIEAPPLPQPKETAVYLWRSPFVPEDGPSVVTPVVPGTFVAPEDQVGDPGADAQLGSEVRKVLKDLGYSN